MSNLLAESLMNDESNLIDVTLHYIYKRTKKGGRKIQVLSQEEGEKKIEEGDEDVEVLNTKWKIASWEEQNRIIADCQQVNPMTSQSEPDWTKYRDLRIKTLLVEWDLEHEGQKLPLNDEFINKLPAEIVLGLFDRFERLSGMDEDEQGK